MAGGFREAQEGVIAGYSSSRMKLLTRTPKVRQWKRKSKQETAGTGVVGKSASVPQRSRCASDQSGVPLSTKSGAVQRDQNRG